MSVTHDLISRMDATGDRHDREMAMLAVEEMEAIDRKIAALEAENAQLHADLQSVLDAHSDPDGARCVCQQCKIARAALAQEEER